MGAHLLELEAQTLPLPLPGTVSSPTQEVGGASEDGGQSRGTRRGGWGLQGALGPRTLPSCVLEHMPLKGSVPGVCEAGGVELGEPGLEVCPLLG